MPTLKTFPVLLTTWLVTGAGAVAGSILGNSMGSTGLMVGAVLGGMIGLGLAVALAARMGWLPPALRRGAFFGGLLGFAVAIPIAVSNLDTPITPVLSCGLTGIGALLGAGMARGMAAGIALLLGAAGATAAQAVAPGSSTEPKERIVQQARGTFDVTLHPHPTVHAATSPTLGRMSIDKTFRGDLTGTSEGEMLTAGSEVKTSAGYVAIERVSGTLGGRTGSFVLQHTGTMTRGAPSLAITVVPDSGTGGLAGITGTMTITIADGTHSYLFEYTLP